MKYPAICARAHPDASGQSNGPEDERRKRRAIVTSRRLAIVLIVFRIVTLAIIMLSALRILVCPYRDLSDVELSFLKWSLGTAVVLLWAGNAIKRRQQKNVHGEEDHNPFMG